jgi:hypothetical protein
MIWLLLFLSTHIIDGAVASDTTSYRSYPFPRTISNPAGVIRILLVGVSSTDPSVVCFFQLPKIGRPESFESIRRMEGKRKGGGPSDQ